MDIRAALLEEHSLVRTKELTQYIGNDPDRFALLWEAFMANEPTLSQRAAWVLRKVWDAHPELLAPYIDQLAAAYPTHFSHDAQLRNASAILAGSNLPESELGRLVDVCFSTMLGNEAPAAIKVHCMQIAFNICQREPELIPELRLAIESRMQVETPAFCSRGRRLLMGLERL